MSVFHTWEYTQVSVCLEIGGFYIWETECLYKQLIGKDGNFIWHDYKTSCLHPFYTKSGATHSEMHGVLAAGLGRRIPNYKERKDKLCGCY